MPKYSPHNPIYKQSQPNSTLNLTEIVSHPYKTTGKIMILCIGCLKTDNNIKHGV